VFDRGSVPSKQCNDFKGFPDPASNMSTPNSQMRIFYGKKGECEKFQKRLIIQY